MTILATSTPAGRLLERGTLTGSARPASYGATPTWNGTGNNTGDAIDNQAFWNGEIINASGTFKNEGTVTRGLTNTGTSTNSGAIDGLVTNSGTLTTTGAPQAA
jgi:hypothetical protein